MKTVFEQRRACNPVDAKSYDTSRLRKEFLVQDLFIKDQVKLSLSQYERYMIGAAFPVNEVLPLEAV